MSLEDISSLGLSHPHRPDHVKFLHRELSARMAHAAKEILLLPKDLFEHPSIQCIYQRYSNSIMDFEDFPSPDSEARHAAFMQLLSQTFALHSEDIADLAWGLSSWKGKLTESSASVLPTVDAHVRNFCAWRIGLRLLMKHYLDSQSLSKPSYSGAFELDCSPTQVAWLAGTTSTRLCKASLGQAPPVLVDEKAPGAGHLTYVPEHLQYVLTEVLKNACRAVVERHGHGFDDELPPVRCSIERGAEDITWSISDEGAGINHGQMRDIWKFMYTTSRSSPWATDDEMVEVPSNKAMVPARAPPRHCHVLAGFGVGLPLSRLYASYFGGTLGLDSVPGIGTTAKLTLRHTGQRLERLPFAL